MHDCDKDERIKKLEGTLEKSARRMEIAKIILTPKVLLCITLAIGMVLQTIVSAFK